MPGTAFVGRNGERPQLAPLDLGREFAIAADARCDVPAHDRGLRFTTARVGDVVDLGRFHAGRLRDHSSHDVIGAAGGAAAPGDGSDWP